MSDPYQVVLKLSNTLVRVHPTGTGGYPQQGLICSQGILKGTIYPLQAANGWMYQKLHHMQVHHFSNERITLLDGSL